MKIQTLKPLRHVYVLTALFLSLLTMPLAYGQDPQLDTAVEQLVETLGEGQNLTADVSLLMLDQEGRELQESLARLVMEKPDRFYWEIIEPYEELTIIYEDRLWLFEPDLDQVTIQNFDDDFSRTPILLLNGDPQALANSYDVSVTSLDDDNKRFVLLPKDPGSIYQRLSLSFLNSMLEEMQFEDSFGQKTSLSFTNIEMNTEIPSDIFIFDIPDGIEVIDSSAD